VVPDKPVGLAGSTSEFSTSPPIPTLQGTPSARAMGIKAILAEEIGENPRRSGNRRSLRRFHSNLNDCGDPRESTVPTRLAQKSQASSSEEEAPEAAFDWQEEPQPRVRTEPSPLPPKTSELVEATSEQEERGTKVQRLFEGKGSGTDTEKCSGDPIKHFP